MDECEWKRMRGVAKRYFGKHVRDPDQLDEFIQESCVRGWMVLRRENASEMPPWLLHGICWRVMSEHNRQKHRQIPQERFFERRGMDRLPHCDHTRHLPLPGGPWSLPRLLDLLRECIEELPEHYRDFMRERMHGDRMREIAHRHGVTLAAVRMRLFRGRRMLSEAILKRLEGEDDEVQKTGA